jgi:hypothetical protein
MKKMIGFALWLAALLIPFRSAILDTQEVVFEDGRANNTVGLISFVAMLILFFIGYALVDSAGNKATEGQHGH